MGEATEHQEASDGGACAALSGIAVDDYDVSGISREELVHGLADFEQYAHSWAVMVLPVILLDLVFELFVVVLPAREVED